MLLKRLIGVALLASSAQASAAVVLYGHAATFRARAQPTIIETFTSGAHFPILSGVLDNMTTEAGLVPGDIQAGVRYSTLRHNASEYFFNIDSGGGFSGGFLDSLYDPSGDPRRALDIAFDTPQYSFGFDTNALMGAFTVSIFDANGMFDTYQFGALPTQTMRFFGFGVDTPIIHRVRIQGSHPGVNFAIDNINFGAQSAALIPEPAQWVMLVAGFGMGGVALRSRRRGLNARSADQPS